MPKQRPSSFARGLGALMSTSPSAAELENRHHREAFAELQRIRAAARDYDARLNAEERAPTGADYEALLAILQQDPLQG